MTTPGTITFHATCVALNGRGVLITGASGTGKSALALELMARGAELVSDDGVMLRLIDGVPVASAPAAIRGMIEARGVGLLAAETCPAAPVVLVVDLDHPETERLPPMRETRLLDVPVPLVHNCVYPHFPAAILQYLKGGRRA
ncbi:HPr kinase/phosphorylase [Actibacterium sp. XHP0104]|uniref:HPr kinase/phosphorylase n=1 Tax=Actibacterium sp. XHP0104 TaxID=2984335 RepID=UPI0021E74A6D|nr:HPr kinase/phosphatase C-terminal domain-containing protein [Actibacterium sp. XHP0104]MCV2881596.1 HPr kinase/phosphatase C-terminal domain-containing protein [Actibacterium sp. XHP0104]